MIYQHRQVVCREGRLEARHAAFQTGMSSLDAHGSVLIGAWEVLIGPDAGCAVFQLRQFDDLGEWERHQARVRKDAELSKQRRTNLFPNLDYVETAILRQADDTAPLPHAWPAIEAVRGTPRGYIEQRILHFRPGGSGDHHALYLAEVAPALERNGAHLLGLFDTVIGPGTMNAELHRSVELRHFPDMQSWQRWREAQDTDQGLRELVKQRWMKTVARIDSVLMRPLDYSRIR